MIVSYEKEFDTLAWGAKTSNLIKKRFKSATEYRSAVDKWFAEYQWPFSECCCECYRQHLWPKYFYSSVRLTEDLILNGFDKKEIDSLLLQGHITFYIFLYKYQTMRCNVHILPDMCFWFYDPPIRSSLYFLFLNPDQINWFTAIGYIDSKCNE
jgi:hypothetical protein